MPSLLERCFDSCGCQVKPSNGDGVAISVERTPHFTTPQHVRDIDRNPATEARNRKVAISAFVIILVLAVVLTVVGLAFRGPGWKFVPPWDHNYIEM